MLLLVAACKGKSGDSTPAPTSGTDPLTNYQWHILNTGQSNFSGTPGVVGADVNLLDVHSEFTGEGVSIAVSDGRIDLDHEDLRANADFANSKDYQQPFPYSGTPTTSDDTDGHGTAVSGLIGAVKGNARGGFGLAPSASLIGMNFLISDQSTSRYVDQSQGPAQVFNYSYGVMTCEVAPPDTAFLDSVRYETLVNDKVYVTSVGNDYTGDAADCGGSGSYYGNGNLNQEKSYPYLIVVAANNSQDLSASYSTQSANTWISAPGGDFVGGGVLSTDLAGCASGMAVAESSNAFDKNSNRLNSGCRYVIGSTIGTSFASPIVAGAIGLLKSVDSFSWREVKHLLAKTARPIEPGLTSWVTNAAGFKFHNFFGFGALDVKAAVELAKARTFDLFDLRQTSTDYSGNAGYQSGTVNLAIPDNLEAGVTSTINVNRHNLWIEHVQVKLSVTHAAAQELGISLTSPSGTVATLAVANNGSVDSNLVDVTFGANAFYGERSSGNWVLKVKDKTAAQTGTLVRWSLQILGNKGTLADVTPPAPVTGLGNTGNTLSWVASGDPGLLRYEACVLPGATATCRDHDWINLGVVTTKAVTNYSSIGNLPLVSGSPYVFKIRAIDTSENASTVVEHTWTAP